MNREQIAGFLMGISVGTAIGFFLRPPENHRREISVPHRRRPAALHASSGCGGVGESRFPGPILLVRAVRPSIRRWRKLVVNKFGSANRNRTHDPMVNSRW
jgi:hypothetical protein